MLKLENVTKIYKIGSTAFYALNNISIIINDGEMLAIRGKSGAGKSTLLHILGCLDTFELGNYYIDDINIKSLSDTQLSKIRNQKIGFIMQDYSLINHRTGLYNVKAPMLFNNTPYFEMKNKAYKALKEVGVPEQANKEVINMSGGQRQRVAIARAIVNEPSIILADEPTGNLDSITSNEIMKLLKRLNEQGKTVIIVTHDENVASFCNREIFISDGKIISDI